MASRDAEGAGDGSTPPPHHADGTPAGASVLLPGRLSRKVLLALLAGLIPASVLVLVLTITAYNAHLNLERRNLSEQVNRLLKVSLENAMLKRDIPGLEEIVTRFASQAGIARVFIVNPDRKVCFANDAALHDRVITFSELLCPACEAKGLVALAADTRLLDDRNGSPILRSVLPVRNRPACRECHGPEQTHPVNGVLVVDYDAANMRVTAFRNSALLSVCGLAVLLLSLAIAWLALSRLVLKPIGSIDAASRRLGAGELSARIEEVPVSNDEIGDLGRSFNRMAASLEISHNELESQQAFVKALLDTVPDAVRVIDEDYRLVLTNQAYARQMGNCSGCFSGSPCYASHGRDRPFPATLVTCPFEAADVDGDPIRYIHTHRRGDGAEVHVETVATRVSIERDGRRRVLVVEAMRDLEQQVKYSQEQRLSEIGQLAAGVAHEIYNPLASVRLGLQALRNSIATSASSGQEVADYVALVDGEVQKSIEVAKRLLNLGQLPSSDLQLVSVAAVIPEVLSLLHYEAEQRKVEMVTDLGDSDLRVLATDAELRMLILNLSQNAFHAMKEGGRLTVSGHEGCGWVTIRFTDTGRGIAPDDLQKIFDPFYSKRADGVAGTGLGLTICKAITGRYGGRIEVESEPGFGSTFIVSLPSADGAGAGRHAAE
ncbi:MAG: ATP-binding protein [Hyphomicrobiaceae bacterium]